MPAGAALTVMNGDLTVTTAGATYTNLDIHGYVVIKAPNVTIKNSIIRGGTGNNGLGIVSDTDNAATNFLLEDSTIFPANPVVGLDDIKGWNYTALRDNIYGSVDGLKMYGDNATVESSWIHDLVTYAHDPAQGGGPVALRRRADPVGQQPEGDREHDRGWHQHRDHDHPRPRDDEQRGHRRQLALWREMHDQHDAEAVGRAERDQCQ